MGVNLRDLVHRKDLTITQLKDKTLGVDAFNILYQFLSTIRGPDGSLLTDSKGRVTSHISGLFFRTTKLMQRGVRLVFIFDGEAPELKRKERERRRALKEEATLKLEVAEKEGSIEEMKKYSQRTSKLTSEMITDAKRLLFLLGIPVVQAPSEGEAQAAYMVKKGDLYAEISQDFDCLLFGAPRLVQNLTISETRKVKNKLSYESVKPQETVLDDVLAQLEITHDQLIVLGILVGTDFNVGGVKGVGPKKALQLVKKYGTDYDALFAESGWDFPYSWKEVFDVFKKIPTTNDYVLSWKPLDREGVLDFLVREHDFNEQRVRDALHRLEEEQKKFQQRGLGQWF